MHTEGALGFIMKKTMNMTDFYLIKIYRRYYCEEIFVGYMALRLNIRGITNATHNWTCKVQIVDISRERQSPEKKLSFQKVSFWRSRRSIKSGQLYMLMISTNM